MFRYHPSYRRDECVSRADYEHLRYERDEYADYCVQLEQREHALRAQHQEQLAGLLEELCELEETYDELSERHRRLEQVCRQVARELRNAAQDPVTRTDTWLMTSAALALEQALNDSCPHNDDPALCNACRNVYED